MTTVREGFEAGVDAVIADNTLNKGGFADAIRSVITSQLSNAEATAWIDDIAVEYEAMGTINNGTYNSFRGQIINDGKDKSMRLFDNVVNTLTGLPSGPPVVEAAALTTLRDERDNVDAAIDRMDVLIANEPSGTVGRLVKEQLREGKQRLKDRKTAIRAAIQAITGDPDS